MIVMVKRKSIPVGNYRIMMHTAELTPGDRGSCHPDRCGYVHRPERCVIAPDRPGLSALFGRSPEVKATEKRGSTRGIVGGAVPLPFSRN